MAQAWRSKFKIAGSTASMMSESAVLCAVTARLRLRQRGADLGDGGGAALGGVHHQLGQQGVVVGCGGGSGAASGSGAQ